MRNNSLNSNARSTKNLTPAYKRITSKLNLKNHTLPQFIREEYPFIIKFADSQLSPRAVVPLKPKILQKYSKEPNEATCWKTFDEFYEYLRQDTSEKIALRIHGHEIAVRELLNIKSQNKLSTKIIELSLSVIKKKNRECIKNSEEHSRVLIAKTAFTEKLFKGQTVCARINLLKYE